MTGPTRRSVLAGVGAAATGGFAGCNVLEGDDDSPPRFGGEAIEALLSEPAPDVDRPAPIQPNAAAIEAGLDRCTELLSAVPASISAEEVPNGVVRQEIESTRKRALENREAVEAAPDRFEALESLRDARGNAREAAVAFAAVDDDFAADVEAERDDVRAAIGARMARIDYQGDELPRALLLAVRLEDFLTDARRRVRRGFRTPDPSVLDVGELAGEVEFAAAALDTVEHLSERQTEAADDPVDFTRRFEFALESSLRSLSRADVPDRGTSTEEILGEEIDRQSVDFLLGEALRTVRGGVESMETELTEGRLASGLDRALALERDVRALQQVVDRVTEDEFPELETIEQVRAEREAALEAVDTVPTDPSELSLAGDVLVRTLQMFHYTDRGLERYVDRDRDAQLTREYAQYAHHRSRLEALPEAIEAIRTRLDVH